MPDVMTPPSGTAENDSTLKKASSTEPSLSSVHMQRQESRGTRSERDSVLGGHLPDLFHPSRKVGTFGLALLTFFNVSGGPWGSEPIVSSAGPLPGFLCVLFMAVFWGLPISLVTSEMSSAFPNNGGYTLWVDTAFGAFWGFQESWWSWLSCVVDNALYPVLAYETVVAMYQGEVSKPMDADAIEGVNSWWLAYACKLGLTVLFSLPVLLGRTEWVTKGMSIMIVLLTIPFAIMLPYIALTRPMDWSQLKRTRPNLLSDPNIDWTALIHVTFWNFNGFDCASTCAGEVHNPGKSYPHGLLSALVVIVFMTAFPLMIATAANDPPWEDWDVGWWSAIANQSAGVGFAWSVVVSSLIGTFGMHAAVMWEDAWQLCGMAEQGLAPRWLAGRNEDLGTPQNATIVSMGVVILLVMFDFRSMVVVDNFFSVASGLLEIAAFVHLKRTRPDLPRPFSVPGVKSDRSIIAFLFVPVLLGIFVLFTSFDEGWESVFQLIPFLLLGLVLPKIFRAQHAHRKGHRGVSFSGRSEGDVTVPSTGGIYGTLHLHVPAASPMRTGMGLNREASRESLFAEPQHFEHEGAPLLEPVYETVDEVEHIFDETVHFGSIFTDPKNFIREDDEYLSAVGRDLDDRYDEGDDGGDDDMESQVLFREGSNTTRSRASRRRRRTKEDAYFESGRDAYFESGRDEERSYDEASLD